MDNSMIQKKSTWYEKILHWFTEFKIYVLILFVSFGGVSVLFWLRAIGTSEKEPTTNGLGTYGDFIGGIIGTFIALLSIKFLYETLRSQQNVEQETLSFNKVSKETYKQQQLNSLFVELLHEYKEVMRNLSIDKNRGKRFFKEFYNLFYQNTTDEKHAIDEYVKTCSLYRDEMFAYFRVLYRLIQFIDNYEVEERYKSQYVKIIRAQMTDDELLVLRYNALTPIGIGMQQYIIRYNLIKHMPVMRLVEMKKWAEKMSNESINDINYWILTLRKHISQKMKGLDTEASPLLQGCRYATGVKVENENKNIVIEITRKKSPVSNHLDEGFDKIAKETNGMEDFLEEVSKEMFCHSNFLMLYSPSDLSFKSIKERDKCMTGIQISHKKNYSLKLSAVQIKSPE